MRFSFWPFRDSALLFVLAVFLATAAPSQQQLNIDTIRDIISDEIKLQDSKKSESGSQDFKVLNTFFKPSFQKYFTEGLIYYDGFIYESTGRFSGQSFINKWKLNRKTG